MCARVDLAPATIRGMQPNPYEASDLPSDAPHVESPIVVIPSWVFVVMVVVAVVGILVGFLLPAVQMH